MLKAHLEKSLLHDHNTLSVDLFFVGFFCLAELVSWVDRSLPPPFKLYLRFVLGNNSANVTHVGERPAMVHTLPVTITIPPLYSCDTLEK